MKRGTEQTGRLAQLVEAARSVAGGGPSEPGDARPDVLANTFSEQLAFIRDPAPMKFALCTRRAAKSYSFALECIDDSSTHPRSNYVFIGLTRESAKRVFWRDCLQRIDDDYRLGMTFNETSLAARMPNGATIYVLGADSNEKEKRKLLGSRNRKVAIDEAQSWSTDLEALVLGVIKPSLADERGSLSLLGTPGNFTQGYFARVSAGCSANKLGPPSLREPGWSGHAWTTFQNPFIAPQWREEIAELTAANPRIVETPFFRQNYLGEWVVDVEGLVYRFDASRNAWDGVLPRFTDPRGEWHYVLAIDLGYSPDPSAFVLCAYHDFQPTLFVIESYKAWAMDITDVANKVKDFQARFEIDALVIDGSAKQAVEEMRRRHGLDQLVAAEKKEKAEHIALLNDDLVQGKILIDVEACADGLQNREVRGRGTVQESLALVDELAGLVWDPRKLALGKRVEHPGCPNHLTDALLYGWRAAFPYLAVPEPSPAAVPGTPAWADAEAERLWTAELEELEARHAAEREGLGESANWDPRFH